MTFPSVELKTAMSWTADAMCHCVRAEQVQGDMNDVRDAIASLNEAKKYFDKAEAILKRSLKVEDAA